MVCRVWSVEGKVWSQDGGVRRANWKALRVKCRVSDLEYFVSRVKCGVWSVKSGVLKSRVWGVRVKCGVKGV